MRAVGELCGQEPDGRCPRLSGARGHAADTSNGRLLRIARVPSDIPRPNALAQLVLKRVRGPMRKRSLLPRTVASIIVAVSMSTASFAGAQDPQPAPSGLVP